MARVSKQRSKSGKHKVSRLQNVSDKCQTQTLFFLSSFPFSPGLMWGVGVSQPASLPANKQTAAKSEKNAAESGLRGGREDRVRARDGARDRHSDGGGGGD